MKKNGSLWDRRDKGSFGGSLPGKKKVYKHRSSNLHFTSSVFLKGTTGAKLTRRMS